MCGNGFKLKESGFRWILGRNSLLRGWSGPGTVFQSSSDALSQPNDGTSVSLA